MTEPRLEFVTCASPAGLHRMAYWEWGDPDNDRVLMCVHGLTRTGRDFDTLAQRLCGTYRVVCPDIVGRGASDWLVNPDGYVVPQYVADLLTLIARSRPSRLDWLGTSMGGLIAIALLGAQAMARATRPETVVHGLDAASGIPFGRIVLNDIGPDLDMGGMARIGLYVGQPVAFDTFDQAVDYVRDISPGFGHHTRQQWETLARRVMVQKGRQWIKHYDLGMAKPFALQNEAALRASEALLWSAYESIQVPVLIVRGDCSDLLSTDTAARMLARNPRAALHVVPDVGHAPTFMSDEQIEPVRRFLVADD
ncbi:MAG TPA: alpha/beta hydrolase [Burkholderiaceae bacterium]|nr:alpha/beta hydrolase [Burkholderiaceae bacterium]